MPNGWNLEITIEKPDVAKANKALDVLYKRLDKVDRKVKSVDVSMRKLGGNTAKGSGAGSGAGANASAGAKGFDNLSKSVFKGNLALRAFAVASRAARQSMGLLIAQAALSAKSFAEFENNIVSISRISGVSEKSVREMSRSFLQLSTEIPVSTETLQGFAEVASRFGIGQAGGAAAVEAFAESFGRLESVIGKVSESTVKSVARIATLTDFPLADINKFNNAVLVLGKNFATSEEQIIRTGERLAQDVAAFGLGADKILGYATAFDSLGIKAEKGGGAFQRVFTAIDKAGVRGGKSLEDLARITGLTTDEFKTLALTEPDKAFDALIESGKRGPEIMRALGFACVRVSSVLSALAKKSDQFTKSLDLSKGSIKTEAQVMADAARQGDTLSGVFKRFTNTLDVARIKLANTSSGPLNDMANKALALASALAGTNDEATKLYPEMAELANVLSTGFETGLSVMDSLVEGVRNLSGPALVAADAFGFLATQASKTFQELTKLSYLEALNPANIAEAAFTAQQNTQAERDENALAKEKGLKRFTDFGPQSKNARAKEIVDGVIKAKADKERQASIDNIKKIAAQQKRGDERRNRLTDTTINEAIRNERLAKDQEIRTRYIGLSSADERIAKLDEDAKRFKADNPDVSPIASLRFDTSIDDRKKEIRKADALSKAIASAKSSESALESNARKRGQLERERRIRNQAPGAQTSAITDIAGAASAIASIKESNKQDKFRQELIDVEKRQLEATGLLRRAILDSAKAKIVNIRGGS